MCSSDLTSFIRGVAPLSAVPLRNDEQDRIWRLGGVFAASPRLELSGTLSLDRVVGTDTIDREPPLYGPASYPFVVGEAAYVLDRHNRIIGSVHYSSFTQERLPLNDFRSTSAMVRYARSF